MATYFWNVASGAWDDPGSWLGGEAPGLGDTGVVAHGPLTNSTPDLSGLSVAGQTIEIVAANQLVFNGTTLEATTSLRNFDADGLTMSFATFNTFHGSVALEGQTSLYLIPGTTAVVINAGTLTVTAPSFVLGEGTLVNSGTIQVGDAGDPAAVVNFAVPSFAVTTQNDGLIEVTGAPSAPLESTTAHFETVTGSGTVRASHAEVTFLGSVAGGIFEFADATAVLQLNNGGMDFGATIKGYQLGNRIDLGTTGVDTVEYLPDPGGNSGILRLYDGATPVAALAFEGSYTTGSFVLGDIGGDLSLTAPCFAEGTKLRTARGEVAVEALAVGDEMPTRLGGGAARVVWTGFRRVDCRRHPRPQDVMPVRVRKGAFAAGVPARDVVLSPDHAVFQGGVLIPVRYLVNDATIVQETVAAVTYWHVELERHDVIEAAGLAVESYLDTGNRGDFANVPGALRLHPTFGREDAAMATWEARACAPLRLGGAEVVAVQRGLIARAEALGWRMADMPALRLFADGVAVAAIVEGAEWLVPLPKRARWLRLVCGAGVPERLRPGSGDGRRLGVAIAAPRWDGVAAALEDGRFLSGWHAAEAGWRWSDGDAVLDVAGLADIAFRLVAGESHWQDRPPMAA